MQILSQQSEALLALADAHGTPTYVYDEHIIRQQCQLLKSLLTNQPVRWLYAMKANSHPAILDIIRDEGLGIDAVSPAEALLALKVGFDPAHILYSANNITDAEMVDVVEMGVLLNVGELSRLERLGKACPGTPVSVRLNPSIGAGHHAHVVTAGKVTKFGIPLEDIEKVLEIASKYNVPIHGIHQHIGSGIPNTSVLREAIDMLLDNAGAFPDLKFVNFGGGLNIPYRPDEKPIDLENVEQLLAPPLAAFHQAYKNPALTFLFEPGRFLVAQAGILLVRVNTVKEAHGRLFAGTDTGMNHLVRPAMYDAYHRIVNMSNPMGEQKVYEVVGNICESGDVLAAQRTLPEIREGDVLAILDAGAYGMVMASHYNLRALPAEVMIRGAGQSTVITPRRSPSELVSAYYPSA